MLTTPLRMGVGPLKATQDSIRRRCRTSSACSREAASRRGADSSLLMEPKPRGMRPRWSRRGRGAGLGHRHGHGGGTPPLPVSAGPQAGHGLVGRAGLARACRRSPARSRARERPTPDGAAENREAEERDQRQRQARAPRDASARNPHPAASAYVRSTASHQSFSKVASRE